MTFKGVSSEIVKSYATAFRWPTVIATCPVSKFASGGGGSCRGMSGKGWVVVIESNPINDREWRVRCDTNELQEVMAEAYVICE